MTVHLSPKAAEGEKQKIHYRLKESKEHIGLGRPADDGGYTYSSAITANVPWTSSEPVEPGTYCLEMTAKGYQPTEVLFLITPGRTTIKEVTLLPE